MPPSGSVAWPDPELSVGQKCTQIKSNKKTVWEAKGPALEKFENEIFKEIKDLLSIHKEHLELGEQISRTYSFHLWMVGRDINTAVPTIIFTSKSAKLREKVTKLIKKHEILGEFPGFAIKSMDRMPAIVMGLQDEDADSENFRLADGETMESQSLVTVGTAIYTREQPINICGTLVFAADRNETTLGGIIVIADESKGNQYYGFIALHPCTDHSGDSQSIICKDTDLEFDNDSDIASTVTASLRQTPSLRPAQDSSSTLGLHSHSSYRGLSSPQVDEKQKTWRSISRIFAPHPLSIVDSTHGVGTLQEPHRIGTVTAVSTQSGLHYGIFHIEDPRYRIPNRIPLPMRSPGERAYLYPEAVASEMEEGEVWVATGKSGLMRGTIIRNPYFIKLEGSIDYQKMWPIQLERDIVPGDCGSWVVDATSGNLFGHIVAGDSTLHRAYMIQATDVFEDIERTMNTSVLLPGIPLTDDGLSESYAELISNITKETSLNSLYPGQHYGDLSRYLSRPARLNGPSTSRITDRNSSIHVVLYEIEDGHKQMHSQFKDPGDFEWCMRARTSTSPGRLVFLKGFSSPEWLTTLGSQLHVDPEFFRAHLNFINRQEYFEHPALPSSAKAITLRLTTIGQMASHSSNIDNWRTRSIESMQSYLHHLVRDLESCETGDSIVRDFSTFYGGLFSIEQDVSICLVTKGDKWTVLIWSDVGNSLQQGPQGPWNQPYLRSITTPASDRLFPVIQPRPGNGLTTQRAPSASETQDDPNITWVQSASNLPLMYGKLLNPDVMKQDAFYALHDLFTLVAASESQFLNMLETRIDYVSKGPLSELMYITQSLNRHMRRLEQNVSTLKTRGGPQWPRAHDGHMREIADAAIDKLLRDFENLVERANLLSRHCQWSMDLIQTNLTIEEAQRSVHQTQRITQLTTLTLFFLPLSFIASLFSMNVAEFGVGSIHIWVFWVVAIPLVLLILLWVIFGSSWPQRKKWAESIVKQGHFRKLKEL